MSMSHQSLQYQGEAHCIQSLSACKQMQDSKHPNSPNIMPGLCFVASAKVLLCLGPAGVLPIGVKPALLPELNIPEVPQVPK